MKGISKMQYCCNIIYKIIRKLLNISLVPVHYFLSKLLFYVNNVKITSFKTHGIPYIMVTRGGKFVVGAHLSINNNKNSNPIGRESRCSFFVAKGGNLVLGNNVSMSSTAIVCTREIIIEDYVKIGGNTCIYDTDFHSLDYKVRQDNSLDMEQRISKSVVIKKNVFIGAHSTILKGVTIGENSIIGACSVITKSVPPNEVWAGNPAKFIRSLNGDIQNLS